MTKTIMVERAVAQIIGHDEAIRVVVPMARGIVPPVTQFPIAPIVVQCKSAWGTGADRRRKCLISRDSEGSRSDAYSHSTPR